MSKNPTADEVGTRLTQERHAAGLGPWASYAQYIEAISAALRQHGIPHAPAQYDTFGECLTCGEVGRCPGVHTFEEIQEAARAEKAARPAAVPNIKVAWRVHLTTAAGYDAGMIEKDTRAAVVEEAHERMPWFSRGEVDKMVVRKESRT